MKFSFDQTKNASNIAKHGLSFELAAEFQWSGERIVEHVRHHGESRFAAIGLIRTRLHVLIFTLHPDAVDVISLRKANLREVRRYETES